MNVAGGRWKVGVGEFVDRSARDVSFSLPDSYVGCCQIQVRLV